MVSERNERIKILLRKLEKKEIYLYGAGKRGRVALENLNMLGFGQKVKGFIDDNYRGKVCCGKQCILLENIDTVEKQDIAFIITTYAVSRMACKLMENNILAENIYFFSELLIDNIETEIFRDNKEKIEQVYNVLNDNLSKYIYNSLFQVYICGNVEILSRTKGDIQYFPIEGTSDEIEEFHISENESFVDCGAYDGDTIREFKRRTNNKYKKIWAFEPDADNFLKLSDYVTGELDERVQLFQSGAYDDDTTMFFTGNWGTSSALNQIGEESIKVNRIDSLIKEPVTFIKMDIEGSEAEALLGAARIISKYKPKLAICIYHKVEDLWEIPLLIKSLNPDYHIYIRNYEDRIDETVCYAI